MIKQWREALISREVIIEVDMGRGGAWSNVTCPIILTKIDIVLQWASPDVSTNGRSKFFLQVAQLPWFSPTHMDWLCSCQTCM